MACETNLVGELKLTDSQRNERQNIRNGYLVANRKEALSGMADFASRNNWFAVSCIVEIMGNA